MHGQASDPRLTIPDALYALADRMESKDLEWIVSAIDINREAGGNLAEVLEKIAAVVREESDALVLVDALYGLGAAGLRGLPRSAPYSAPKAATSSSSLFP